MLRFNIFGITVNIQPAFWLIMAMIGGAFPLLSSPSTVGLINLIVFIGAGFVSILTHELGHALVMKRFRSAPQIILHGMGGVMISAGHPLKKSQSFRVIITGPLAQIILGLIAFFILEKVAPESFPTPQSHFFVFYLMCVSIFWALINLLPIYPLDGGLLLKTLLNKPRIVYLISIITISLLGVFCLRTGNFFGLIILIMLGVENFKAFKALKGS